MAVVTSGSELLEPGTPPQPNRVYNSNLPQIRALLRTTPCDVVASVQIGDTLSETVAVLRGLQGRADVILTTAGVSVGEEDHIRPAIEQLGRIEQWRVNLKPGKPFVFGQIGTTPLLGLPGNPVSAFVVFLLFVRPFLLTTAGGRAPTLPTWSACADFEIQQTGARREYRRALIAPREDGLWLTLYPDQDSANLASISGSDALVLLPPKSAIARGDRVWFHPLSGLLHG